MKKKYKIVGILITLLLSSFNDLHAQNWDEIIKNVASDASALDYSGQCVSISGDRAIVGAFQDDDGGSNSGSVYIFEWNGTTWVESAKLTASDAAMDDYFGYSVSISGDKVIVGAINNDDNGSNSGSAYIFEWNGTSWVESAK